MLQQQIRDLQAKQSAAEAAKVSGAPVSGTQHTQAGEPGSAFVTRDGQAG